MLSGSLFLHLVRMSVGTAGSFPGKVEEKDLMETYREADRQTLTGVLLEPFVQVLDSLGPQEALASIKFQWMGRALMIEDKNAILDERAAELTRKFEKLGMKSCVLKGQSAARYYPEPERRQCGDIDIWVDGSRSAIVATSKKIGKVGKVCYHHTDVKCFDDAGVEVHFFPSWFFDPFTDHRFHKWLDRVKEAQFLDRNGIGFNSPDVSFDLVFSMVHIFRHIFAEGVGLRQLMDYYYILMHSDKDMRDDAFKVLSSFRIGGFCSGVMFVLKEIFLLDDRYLLTKPAERYGRPILEQISVGGNFGKYDTRNKNRYGSTWSGLVWTLKHNLRLFHLYPSESFWSPVFKVWQWVMMRVWLKFL